MRRLFLRLLACSALPACELLAPSAVQAQTVYQFELPAQSLADSLRAVGRQTSTNILFEPGVVKNVQAPALRAQLTIDEAISQLLVGTRLTSRQTSSDTLVVESVGQDPGKTADKSPAVPSTSAVPAASGRTRLAQAEQASESVDPQNARAPARNAGVVELEEVVVTGTHIRGADIDGPSPVRTITRAEIDASGYTTTMQLMDSLPVNFGGGINEDTSISGQDIGNTGSNRGRASSVNLRGLGSGATLVLLNGHRLPAASQGVSPDISIIPLSLIERVDVLKDGASPIYGSDAIAGVVNFITRRDFSGAETRLSAGSVTQGGREQYDASQLFGVNWRSGNAVLNVNYNRRRFLDTADRDFSKDATDPSYLLPDSETIGGFASLRQDISDALTVTGDVIYSRRESSDIQSTDVGFAVISGHQEPENRALIGSVGLELELTPAWACKPLRHVFGYGHGVPGIVHWIPDPVSHVRVRGEHLSRRGPGTGGLACATRWCTEDRVWRFLQKGILRTAGRVSSIPG